MVQLHDNDTGALVGTITDDQLQFLLDQLEEESQEDTDYYIDEATLDLLDEGGADPKLMAVLRKALGSRTEMEIRWTRP